jgi:hypothetical protein
MKVTVVSMMAAAHGSDEIVWVGEVPEGYSGHEAETNERLFRYFNRVDGDDERRLAEIGYRLPSLSVGDYLHWQGVTWRVEGSGFSRHTGSDAALRTTLGI